MIRTERGLWKHHQNQLQRRLCNFKTCDDSNPPSQNRDVVKTNDTVPSSSSYSQNDKPGTSHENSQVTSASRRYPARVRKQPNFYQADFS